MAKFTVEFGDQLDSALSKLAQEEHTTKTQVVRKAIALLDVVKEETKGSNKLTVADQNDQVVKEIVL